MGACVSATTDRSYTTMCGSSTCCGSHDKVIEECPICYHVPSQNIPLSCGHHVHTSCLTAWWGKGTAKGLVCPMCRQCTYDCFLELNIADRKPVGYFRQDTPEDHVLLLRKKNYSDPTFVVRLQEDARDVGLTGFMLILAEESPSLKEKLHTALSAEDLSTSTH